MPLIEEHYRTTYDHLVRIAVSRGLPWFLAEETVQETYARAIVHLESFVSNQPFDKWVKQILSNAIKDAYKQERHRGMIGVSKEATEIYQDTTEGRE